MTSVAVDLQAFRLASQKSEIKRLFLLFGIVGVMILQTLARHMAGGIMIQGKAFTLALEVLTLVTCYVACFLFAVRRADRDKRLLPSWVWIFSVIVESSLPTAAVFCLVKLAPINPLEAIAAPAILLYGVFAAANVLRLSPKLCLLFGVVGTSGYVAVTVYAVA
ncbi:MAG: hypothetical protein WC133_07010, partial [Candidatus Omnitrophota bacterium]